MYKIKQGDCLEVMKDIPSGIVDMILCDLPYGTTNCKWDTNIPLKPLWKEYKRIIKANGVVLLFAQTPFDKVLGCSNLQWLKYEWIYEKPNATGHLNSKKAPMKAHENILTFYDKRPTYNPIKTTDHTRKISVADRGRLESELYGAEKGVTKYDSTERFPRTVIKFKSDKQTNNLHPTQKPVSLCEYLIKTYTNEGELVLDNCMGSGSTGVACLNTGRNFIGIEKDEKYFKIAQERLAKTSIPQIG